MVWRSSWEITIWRSFQSFLPFNDIPGQAIAIESYWKLLASNHSAEIILPVLNANTYHSSKNHEFGTNFELYYFDCTLNAALDARYPLHPPFSQVSNSCSNSCRYKFQHNASSSAISEAFLHVLVPRRRWSGPHQLNDCASWLQQETQQG